jgi:hypothetical protein
MDGEAGTGEGIEQPAMCRRALSLIRLPASGGRASRRPPSRRAACPPGPGGPTVRRRRPAGPVSARGGCPRCSPRPRRPRRTAGTVRLAGRRAFLEYGRRPPGPGRAGRRSRAGSGSTRLPGDRVTRGLGQRAQRLGPAEEMEC